MIPLRASMRPYLQTGKIHNHNSTTMGSARGCRCSDIKQHNREPFKHTKQTLQPNVVLSHRHLYSLGVTKQASNKEKNKQLVPEKTMLVQLIICMHEVDLPAALRGHRTPLFLQQKDGSRTLSLLLWLRHLLLRLEHNLGRGSPKVQCCNSRFAWWGVQAKAVAVQWVDVEQHEDAEGRNSRMCVTDGKHAPCAA